MRMTGGEGRRSGKVQAIFENRIVRKEEGGFGSNPK